ncbi:MAG: hypothetical protein QXT73_00725 [Candidatus Methanomethylicaceae archaeon]
MDGDYVLTYLWFRGPAEPQNYWLFLADCVRRLDVDRIAIAWDSHNRRRREILPSYKRRRVVDDEWVAARPQLRAKVQESLQFLPVVAGQVEGLEADDVLWCWSRTRAGVIVSGDQDLLQCLHPELQWYSPRSGKLRGWDDLRAEGGCEGWLVQKCLVGDNSDNIAGVPGIGWRRAKLLWQKYAPVLQQLITGREVEASDDRWLSQVIAAREVVCRNWCLMKLGALIKPADEIAAELIIQEPIKLFDASRARAFVVHEGWHRVLRDWFDIEAIYSRVSAP